MTDICSDTCSGIDSLAQKSCCFALFRLPFADDPVCMIQTTGSPVYLNNIPALNGEAGFVFSPFEITEQYPLVLIKPDIRIEGKEALTRLEEQADVSRLIETAPTFDNKDKEGEGSTFSRYAKAFSSFARPLQENRFRKLVLSRTSTHGKEEDFSPSSAFFKACAHYPSACVYLFHSPVTGTWLGSTPEILLAGHAGQWHTMALAGTKKQQAKLNGACLWDRKNRHEQQVVAEYIRTRLLSFGIQWEEKGPRTLQAGKISHLLTDFYFTLEQTGRVGDLLRLLHPTPAVCGMPKEEAFRHIQENEGYERSYYTGFTGWLDPEGKTDLYVNLRCMHIGRSRLTLYAGGGIMPDSEVKAEWKETEDKLQTMLSILR